MGSTCSTDTSNNEHESEQAVYELVEDFSVSGNSSEVKTHILKPPSEEYELITVLLHLSFNEERKIDVFNGIELEWKHPHTQETYQAKAIGSEFSNDTVLYEINNLDYIERIVWNQHDATKAPFMTHFGVVPKLGKTHEVGAKGTRCRALQNKTAEELQSELNGLELVQSCNDKQYFVSVKAIWRDLPERKTVTLPEPATSFFDYDKSVNLRLISKQLAYLYKGEEAYREFDALIDTRNGTQEYLGALPVRFLSPEEKTRLDNAIKDSEAANLLAELHSRKRFHKQLLPADIKKEVVNFCVHLINKELQKTSTSYLNLSEISDNIRFLNKIFTGIYNDDQELWNEVQAATAESLVQFNSLVFKQALSEMSELHDVQAIQDTLTFEYSENFQKSCPQNVDKGTITDVDGLIEEYTKEARLILVEFHGTLRGQFGQNYLGEPVAEAAKIKPRVQEFLDQDKKLKPSDAVARILDFVKGTIICSNGQDLINNYNALQDLCITKGFTVVKVSNDFRDLTSASWKSLKVYVVAFDCLICEVQLTLNCMKDINEVAQFIDTLQKAKSLYPIVSDYLSHYHQFNNWLGPFLPEYKKLQFPERYVRVKGFYVDYEGKRGYMDMNLRFMQDGGLTGFGVDPLGEYQISGNHWSYKSIKYTKTMVNVPNPWSISYTGDFVDTGVIEGEYWVGNTTGKFRLYVGDYEYPALNSGLVRVNLKEKARKTLPERELVWKGNYCQNGKEYPQDFKLTVLPDGNITGSGKDEIDTFTIIGHHDQYKTFSFIKLMDGNNAQYGKFSVNYEGFFVDNYVVKGKWNSGGFMGNFRIEVADEELKTATQ